MTNQITHPSVPPCRSIGVFPDLFLYGRLHSCIYKHTSNVQTYPHFSVWPVLLHLTLIWTQFPITQFLRRGAWPMSSSYCSSLGHCLPRPLGVYTPLRFDMNPLTRSRNASWGWWNALSCHLSVYSHVVYNSQCFTTPYFNGLGSKFGDTSWVQPIALHPLDQK